MTVSQGLCTPTDDPQISGMRQAISVTVAAIPNDLQSFDPVRAVVTSFPPFLI
jgi:hypothetical protein